MLTQAGCQIRQSRFRALLEARALDAALITDPREIYYLTGLLTPDVLPDPTALIMRADGHAFLISNALETEAWVDDRVAYVPHIGGTRNPDRQRQMAALVGQRCAGERFARVGWQQEGSDHLLATAFADATHPDAWVPLDDDIADLERTKDADEIECIRLSVACTMAAYDAAQLTIAPRVSELVVLSAAQRSANLRAGEGVLHSGDYRAGESGGPARARQIEADDLYIIDAWSHVHGYWSDLSRTFAVTEATPLQREVYSHIADILIEVEGQLGPGLAGTDLWAWIDERIREHPHLREAGLGHHAGHGVGLRAHEGPDLNRERGPELRVGDVVSVEPGSYVPDLRPGFRLENMFLITESGCELLSPYPLSLDRLT